MLEKNPINRISTEDALKHPYFLRSDRETSLIKLNRFSSKSVISISYI